MPQPFDVTMKDLFEKYPLDWLRWFEGELGVSVTIVDADLSTVAAEADKVLRVEEFLPWLLHLEFQASRDPLLARRILRYNVLLYDRHGHPVSSVVVLLRPSADDPSLTGVLSYRARKKILTFEYEVLRVWEHRPEEFLAGGLGMLPLATIADVPEEALPDVIDRMEERLNREADPGERASLWLSTYLLMGLRFPQETASRLLQGVQAMKESTTYQAILEEGRMEGRLEGRLEEGKKVLLLLGDQRFGPPTLEIRAQITHIASVERMEQVTERLLEAKNWEDLLP